MVDRVRAIQLIFPNGRAGNPQRMIDRRRQILRSLRIGCRVGTVLIGCADHGSALRATASDKYRLDGAPMVSARFGTGTAVCGIHFGRASHFADHYDQSLFEHSQRLKIVEQRGDSSVGRRQQAVSQQGEVVVVGIPRFVIAKVHLHQVDTGLNQLPGHQQRPAERVASVAVEQGRVGIVHVKCPLHAGLGQQRNGCLTMPVERLDRSCQVEIPALPPQQFADHCGPPVAND